MTLCSIYISNVTLNIDIHTFVCIHIEKNNNNKIKQYV